MFLYIDPLKQGLKQAMSNIYSNPNLVFIHRSIKTRIETVIVMVSKLSMHKVFIHRSIKTRIET